MGVSGFRVDGSGKAIVCDCNVKIQEVYGSAQLASKLDVFVDGVEGPKESSKIGFGAIGEGYKNVIDVSTVHGWFKESVEGGVEESFFPSAQIEASIAGGKYLTHSGALNLKEPVFVKGKVVSSEADMEEIEDIIVWSRMVWEFFEEKVYGIESILYINHRVQVLYVNGC